MKKRIISVAIVLIMCMGLFGGCADMVDSYEWSGISFSYEFVENEEEFSYEFLREIYDEIRRIMPYNSVLAVNITYQQDKVVIYLREEKDIEQIIAHLRGENLYVTEAIYFALLSNARPIPPYRGHFWILAILGIIFLILTIIFYVKKRRKNI